MTDVKQQSPSDSDALRGQLAQLGDPVVVCSFPRSGTHFMIDLLRRQFPACRARKRWGQSVHSVYLNLDQLLPSHPRTLDAAAALDACRRMQRPIIKTHAFPDFEEWTGPFSPWIEWIRQRGTVLYMVRDLHKVLCSYHLLAQHVDEAARRPLEDFLSQRVSYFMPSEAHCQVPVDLWRDHVQAWIGEGRTNLFFYGDLVRHTERCVRRLQSVLDEEPQWQRPLLPARPVNIWQGRLARLFARVPQSTAILTRTRHHKRQEWHDQLTPDLQREMDARCRDLQARLTAARNQAQAAEEPGGNVSVPFPADSPAAGAADSPAAGAAETPGGAYVIRSGPRLRPPIILLGTHRSGTTWMGRAFSTVPDVAYWSEPRAVWVYGNWFREDDVLTEQDARPAVVRYIRQRFERFTRAHGKLQFCEKTPSNCLRVRFLRTVFPEAKFILMLRDGRSVLRSAREIQEKGGARWKRIWERCLESRPRELPAYLERLPLVVSKMTRQAERVAWGIRPPGWRRWLQEDPNYVFLAKQWAGSINRALDDMEEVDADHKLVFPFEDLAGGDQELLNRIVTFAEIPDPRPMIEFIQETFDPNRTTRWESQMDAGTLEQVRPIVEPTLKRMHYRW